MTYSHIGRSILSLCTWSSARRYVTILIITLRPPFDQGTRYWNTTYIMCLLVYFMITQYFEWLSTLLTHLAIIYLIYNNLVWVYALINHETYLAKHVSIVIITVLYIVLHVLCQVLGHLTELFCDIYWKYAYLYTFLQFSTRYLVTITLQLWLC